MKYLKVSSNATNILLQNKIYVNMFQNIKQNVIRKM